MTEPRTAEQIKALIVQSEELWDEVDKGRRKRTRDFITGAALATAATFALSAIALYWVGGYTVGTSLLLAFIGSVIYAAGAYTGFTAFDEWIEVRTTK